MKWSKFIILFLLITTISIFGCKNKSVNDMIVKQWKFTNIQGDLMPDSIKAKIYANATMEFKKDGKYETSGLAGGNLTGTYTVINDGKNFTTKSDGSIRIDTFNILEITEEKMVFQNTNEEVKISFKSK